MVTLQLTLPASRRTGLSVPRSRPAQICTEDPVLSSRCPFELHALAVLRPLEGRTTVGTAFHCAVGSDYDTRQLLPADTPTVARPVMGLRRLLVELVELVVVVVGL